MLLAELHEGPEVRARRVRQDRRPDHQGHPGLLQQLGTVRRGECHDRVISFYFVMAFACS